jgi:hypothetical protein
VALLDVGDRHRPVHSEIDPVLRRDGYRVSVLLPRDVGDPVGRIVVDPARNLQLLTGVNDDFLFRIGTAGPDLDRRPSDDGHLGKLGDSGSVEVAGFALKTILYTR